MKTITEIENQIDEGRASLYLMAWKSCDVERLRNEFLEIVEQEKGRLHYSHIMDGVMHEVRNSSDRKTIAKCVCIALEKNVTSSKRIIDIVAEAAEAAPHSDYWKQLVEREKDHIPHEERLIKYAKDFTEEIEPDIVKEPQPRGRKLTELSFKDGTDTARLRTFVVEYLNEHGLTKTNLGRVIAAFSNAGVITKRKPSVRNVISWLGVELKGKDYNYNKVLGQTGGYEAEFNAIIDSYEEYQIK